MLKTNLHTFKIFCVNYTKTSEKMNEYIDETFVANVIVSLKIQERIY